MAQSDQHDNGVKAKEVNKWGRGGRGGAESDKMVEFSKKKIGYFTTKECLIRSIQNQKIKSWKRIQTE